jgi:dethiobiotin synthetase
MPGLFIAGTGTDVGKTYVTKALIRALLTRGRAVDALKPVVSGFDPAEPQASDPAGLLEVLGREATPQAIAEISPWRFAAPLSPPLAARREGRSLDADEVAALCRRRLGEARDRLLIIESAGGIMSPLDDHSTMLALAAALELPVLLVAGSYLGAISHTLTALATLSSENMRTLAVVVSESPDAPPLHETVEALRGFVDALPILALARNAPAPAELVDLI